MTDQPLSVDYEVIDACSTAFGNGASNLGKIGPALSAIGENLKGVGFIGSTGNAAAATLDQLQPKLADIINQLTNMQQQLETAKGDYIGGDSRIL